jgi:hypothetical protein
MKKFPFIVIYVINNGHIKNDCPSGKAKKQIWKQKASIIRKTEGFHLDHLTSVMFGPIRYQFVWANSVPIATEIGKIAWLF